MPRLAAAALLLMLPATARADAGGIIPGIRTIWIDRTFTVDQDYPDYEFYLLPSSVCLPAERLRLTASNPVRISGTGEEYRYVVCPIYAVPKSLLAEFVDSPPPRGWFSDNFARGVQKVEDPDYGIYFLKSAPFTDDRERAEIVSRIEKGPDGWRLVQVSENAGNPWARRAWIAGGIFTAVGFICLGLRLLSRLFGVRSGSQPPQGENGPPPSEVS